MSSARPAGPQLRNSCDACNLSKVKCNKGRPQCQRCENRKEPCVYSVSLRSLPRRNTAGGSAAGDNANSNKSANAAAQTGNVRDTSKARRTQHMKIPSGKFPGRALNTPALTDVEDTNIFDLQFDSNTDFSDVSDMTGLPDGVDFNDPTGFLAQVLTTSSANSHAHDQEDSQMTDFNVAYGSYMELPSPPASMSNMIMQSLSQGQVSCGCQQNILSKLSELSFPRGTPFAFDKALSTNKLILDLCISTLECGNFRLHVEDTALALTLVTLITHIISTFDLLFKLRRDSHSSAAASPGAISSSNESIASSLASSGFSTPSNGSISGSMPSVRLMLGTYQLDRADEEALQLSLIKIELTKVERLIDVTERCFQKETIGSTTRLKTDADLLRGLTGYLRKRLWCNQEELRLGEKR